MVIVRIILFNVIDESNFYDIICLISWDFVLGNEVFVFEFFLKEVESGLVLDMVFVIV